MILEFEVVELIKNKVEIIYLIKRKGIKVGEMVLYEPYNKIEARISELRGE